MPKQRSYGYKASTTVLRRIIIFLQLNDNYPKKYRDIKTAVGRNDFQIDDGLQFLLTHKIIRKKLLHSGIVVYEYIERLDFSS